MGAGKTSIGRLMAARLQIPWYDNDVELTSQSGRTAAELASEGAQLHDRESDVLHRRAVALPPFVAGVAAGVADRPEDLALLRRTGWVVYLRAQLETLLARVSQDPRRPWLDSDPAAWLEAHLGSRDASYVDAADIVLEVGDRSPGELSMLACAKLAGRGATAPQPGS
jgi:shikimate kinase